MSTSTSPLSGPTFACSDRWRAWWQDPALSRSVLDAGERVAIILLFFGFLNALAQSIAVSLTLGKSVAIGDFMVLITESMMVILVLCRHDAKCLSEKPIDWGLAFGASCLSLLAYPCPGQSHSWDTFAISLTVAGFLMQLVSKLTLNRRFGLVAANRGLCTVGTYRFVRHPIYFGYVLLHTGFFLLNPSLWNLMVFVALYSLKIPRILAEEQLLSQDSEYRVYMSQVPYRLIPGVF